MLELSVLRNDLEMLKVPDDTGENKIKWIPESRNRTKCRELNVNKREGRSRSVFRDDDTRNVHHRAFVSAYDSSSLLICEIKSSKRDQNFSR